MQWLLSFWLEQQGQDIIEYSLLITFIAIACLALLGAGQPSVKAIWENSNNHLEAANAAIGGG